MKARLLILAFLFANFASVLPSQAQTAVAQNSSPLYWTIPPALDRSAALNLRIDLITSLSLHTYLLNGRIPITEMLVRTSDGHIVSLYTIRDDKVKSSDKSTRDYIREFIKNAKDNCSSIYISRHYPGESTRGVVEYYIPDKSKLWEIYDKLNESMILKKNLTTNL